MNKEIIAYAEHFVSFLVHNVDKKSFENIKEIILFGSVARGEADKASDVDIFVNVFREDKFTERVVHSMVNKFYSSQASRSYWKLLGMENEIKCIVGRMERWKDLEPSIISNGLVLYGKYTGLLKGRSFILIYWDKVRPEAKRVFLSKKLYGYTYNKKRYKGAIEGTGTIKLGSNCVLAPMESSAAVLQVFRVLGVQHRKIYVSRPE